MLRIALSTLAARKGGMFGAFAAVGLAVVLVVSCGILLESSLRAPIPVERLAAAAVVVQANPSLSGQRRTSASRCPSGDGSPAALADRLRTLPGVTSGDRRPIVLRSRSSIADGRAADRAPSGAPPVGHGWDSAALTPFALTSGHAPARQRGSRARRAISRARGSIELGDHVQIVTAADRRATSRVVGIAQPPSGRTPRRARRRSSSATTSRLGSPAPVTAPT